MTPLVALLVLGPDPVLAALSPDARAILAHPDRITVHQIEFGPGGVGKSSGGFPGAVSTKALGAKDAKDAVSALYANLRSPLPAMKCFNPRHGLLAAKGKRWVRIAICFECHLTEVVESSGRRVHVESGVVRAVFDRLVPGAAVASPVLGGPPPRKPRRP